MLYIVKYRKKRASRLLLSRKAGGKYYMIIIIIIAFVSNTTNLYIYFRDFACRAYEWDAVTL